MGQSNGHFRRDRPRPRVLTLSGVGAGREARRVELVGSAGAVAGGERRAGVGGMSLGYDPRLLAQLVAVIRVRLALLPASNGFGASGSAVYTVVADSRAVALELCARLTAGEVARLRWRYRDEEAAG